jgi:hypothetical protein
MPSRTTRVCIFVSWNFPCFCSSSLFHAPLCAFPVCANSLFGRLFPERITCCAHKCAHSYHMDGYTHESSFVQMGQICYRSGRCAKSSLSSAKIMRWLGSSLTRSRCPIVTPGCRSTLVYEVFCFTCVLSLFPQNAPFLHSYRSQHEL